MTLFDGAIEIAEKMILRLDAGIDQGFEDFGSDAHVTTVEYERWFTDVERKIKEEYGDASTQASEWQALQKDLSDRPYESDVHILRRYIDELQASISHLKMLSPPPSRQRAKWTFLSDQRWTGIGGIVAILALFVAIFSGDFLPQNAAPEQDKTQNTSNTPPPRQDDAPPAETIVPPSAPVAAPSESPDDPVLVCDPIPISNSDLKAQFLSAEDPPNCAVELIRGDAKIWATYAGKSGDYIYSFGNLSFAIVDPSGAPTTVSNIEVVSAAGIRPRAINRLICADANGQTLEDIEFADGETANCVVDGINQVDIKTDLSFALAGIRIE